MQQPGGRLLARERTLILAMLLLLAAIGWAVVVWRATAGSDDAMAGEMDGGVSLTMGMSAALFLAIWVAMMVAMMFPTAAPMILTFAQVQANRRTRGDATVPVWLFVLGYLAAWSAFGVVAYTVAAAADGLADRSMWLMDNAARFGGGVFVLAGVYQLSPLKNACLSRCRTPMSFVLTSWRDGARGALRMGLAHGAYCLGCCWLLFVLLLPLGMMNVAAMALITLLIFAEKSFARGAAVARGAAIALILYGVLVIGLPSALPTTL